MIPLVPYNIADLEMSHVAVYRFELDVSTSRGYMYLRNISCFSLINTRVNRLKTCT